ncbi:MAG: methionine synthase [Bacillota bacterium]
MQIKINKSDVARYLGYKNAVIDAQTEKDIDFCCEMLADCMSPQTYYRVFEIEKSETIKIKNTTLALSGNSAKQLLEDCESCVLMISTLGGGVDELIRKLQITNMPHAVIADFCASSLVEELTNHFEEKIKSDILKSGEYFTDRFSPGYGDLPLEIQSKFCEILQSGKTVGVFVNSAGIMIPRKTITAVIGIANKPQKKKIKGCAYCDLAKNCEFKKGGRSCE